MGSLWGEGVALVQPDRPVGIGGGASQVRYRHIVVGTPPTPLVSFVWKGIKPGSPVKQPATLCPPHSAS